MGQEHGWAVCGNEVKAVTLCSRREGAACPREQQGQEQSKSSNEMHEKQGYNSSANTGSCKHEQRITILEKSSVPQLGVKFPSIQCLHTLQTAPKASVHILTCAIICSTNLLQQPYIPTQCSLQYINTITHSQNCIFRK